jgi:phosphoribosylpyrophosphate synthetase
LRIFACLRSAKRGDHKEPDKRCPIAAKLIAGMLETAGTNQVSRFISVPEFFNFQLRKCELGKSATTKNYFPNILK